MRQKTSRAYQETKTQTRLQQLEQYDLGEKQMLYKLDTASTLLWTSILNAARIYKVVYLLTVSSLSSNSILFAPRSLVPKRGATTTRIHKTVKKNLSVPYINLKHVMYKMEIQTSSLFSYKWEQHPAVLVSISCYEKPNIIHKILKSNIPFKNISLPQTYFNIP